MARDRDNSPFTDDESSAKQILQGLISPVPAQSLVMPPSDTPPRSGPGESTPLTGNLRAAPSQATPKISPAPQDSKLEGKARRGLAGYFSAGTGNRAGKSVQSAGDQPMPELEIQQAIGVPARDLLVTGKNGDGIKTARNKQNVASITRSRSRNGVRQETAKELAGLRKGSVIALPDGSRGTVSYLDPNMKIARVRTEDGRNLTVRLGQLRVP